MTNSTPSLNEPSNPEGQAKRLGATCNGAGYSTANRPMYSPTLLQPWRARRSDHPNPPRHHATPLTPHSAARSLDDGLAKPFKQCRSAQIQQMIRKTSANLLIGSRECGPVQLRTID
jgi:hypothetical protein